MPKFTRLPSSDHGHAFSVRGAPALLDIPEGAAWQVGVSGSASGGGSLILTEAPYLGMIVDGDVGDAKTPEEIWDKLFTVPTIKDAIEMHKLMVEAADNIG